MTDIWFISDTHFSHGNFLNFFDNENNKIRKFSTVEEMDDCLITKWNEKVSKTSFKFPSIHF